LLVAAVVDLLLRPLGGLVVVDLRLVDLDKHQQVVVVVEYDLPQQEMVVPES
jgi:hypothetical protein